MIEYEVETPKKEDVKINTKEQSFLLFKRGKSIEEIAKERLLAVTTIEGHLMPYVESGDIPLEKLVAPERIDEIRKALQQKPEATTLSEIKEVLGDDYSWAEIRFVKATQI
jgi:uncharacterized protein YpbB